MARASLDVNQEQTGTATVIPVPAPRQTMLRLTWRRFRRHPMAIIGSIVLLGIILLTTFAFLSPYDPNAIDVARRFEPPSLAHPMGTDRSGRDIFTRVLYGGRISLVVGVTAMAAATVIGTIIGGLAGYFGGWVDTVLMRFTDFALSFPSLLILILLSFLLRESGIPFFDGGVASIALVIAATSWMSVARLARATFLSVKEQEYVTATRAYGASSLRIMVVHILPNTAGPIIVMATMGVAWAILTESGLSFLGFGIQPPTASWGNMLTNAQDTLSLYPWQAVFPGLMIFLTVVSLNYIGDALRDALDPYKADHL
jgi:peptide/nickel transport system permease protein